MITLLRSRTDLSQRRAAPARKPTFDRATRMVTATGTAKVIDFSAAPVLENPDAQPHAVLNSGHKIPLVGLGTW